MRHSAFRRGGRDWNKSFRGEEGFGTYKYTGGVEAVSWLTACTHHPPLHVWSDYKGNVIVMNKNEVMLAAAVYSLGLHLQQLVWANTLVKIVIVPFTIIRLKMLYIRILHLFFYDGYWMCSTSMYLCVCSFVWVCVCVCVSVCVCVCVCVPAHPKHRTDTCYTCMTCDNSQTGLSRTAPRSPGCSDWKPHAYVFVPCHAFKSTSYSSNVLQYSLYSCKPRGVRW